MLLIPFRKMQSMLFGKGVGRGWVLPHIKNYRVFESDLFGLFPLFGRRAGARVDFVSEWNGVSDGAFFWRSSLDERIDGDSGRVVPVSRNQPVPSRLQLVAFLIAIYGLQRGLVIISVRATRRGSITQRPPIDRQHC